MKVIDFTLANAALFPSLDDVRPTHGFAIGDILTAIGDRYQFTNRPNPAQPRPPMQLPIPLGPSFTFLQRAPNLLSCYTFENGGCDAGGRTIRILKLEVTPDMGLIAVQVSVTDEGDEVLADLAGFLERVLSFNHVLQYSQRRYASNLVFEFAKEIDGHVKMIIEMERAATQALQTQSGVKLDAKLERIAFGFDPLDVPAAKAGSIGSFVIERRAGHPYVANRWFSSALIKTADHVRTLEEMEEVLRRQVG